MILSFIFFPASNLVTPEVDFVTLLWFKKQSLISNINLVNETLRDSTWRKYSKTRGQSKHLKPEPHYSKNTATVNASKVLIWMFVVDLSMTPPSACWDTLQPALTLNSSEWWRKGNEWVCNFFPSGPLTFQRLTCRPVCRGFLHRVRC